MGRNNYYLNYESEYPHQFLHNGKENFSVLVHLKENGMCEIDKDFVFTYTEDKPYTEYIRGQFYVGRKQLTTEPKFEVANAENYLPFEKEWSEQNRNPLLETFLFLNNVLVYPQIEKGSPAFDSNEYFIVKDYLNNRIAEIITNYSYKDWNRIGKFVPENPLGYSFPLYACMDKNGNTYVYYSHTGHIDIFDKEGKPYTLANKENKVVLSKEEWEFFKTRVYQFGTEKSKENIVFIQKPDIDRILSFRKEFKAIENSEISQMNNAVLSSLHIDLYKINETFKEQIYEELNEEVERESVETDYE